MRNDRAHRFISTRIGTQRDTCTALHPGHPFAGDAARWKPSTDADDPIRRAMTYRTTICLVRSFNDAVVRVRSDLRPAVVVVGVLGGIVGAAYVAHAPRPPTRPRSRRTTPWACSSLLLVAAGAAVALITRIGGETGDVELLVDNIHVLGGAEDVRAGSARWSRRRSLCVAVGRGHGPGGARWCRARARSARWIGRARTGSPRRISASSPSPAWPPGSPCCSALLWGSAVFALEILHRRGPPVLRGAACPAVVGSLSGYAVVAVGAQRRRHRAGVDVPAGRHRCTPRDLAVGAAIGVAGALGAGAVHPPRRARAAPRVRPCCPSWARPVLGGLVLAAARRSGRLTPSPSARPSSATCSTVRLTAGALAVAAVAKLLGHAR